MPVTEQEVKQIAALAKLKLTDQEKDRMVHDLNEVLAHMRQLNSVDTTDVEPLNQVIESNSFFRNDVVTTGVDQQEALKNAPDRNQEFFNVPKVISEK